MGLRKPLPSLQLGDPPDEHTHQKSGNADLREFVPHSCLHFFNSDVRQEELAFLVAMAAIHRALGAIRVGATSLRIPLEWHPTTLTILIGFHPELLYARDGGSPTDITSPSGSAY